MKKSVFVLISLIIFSCGQKKPVAEKPKINKFETLVQYIEENGDFINSDEAPAALTASEVYASRDRIHIIDIRTPEEFAVAHIPNSINVRFSQLIDYFENKIQSTAYDKIALFSSDGQAAFFAVSMLRLLGYKNVYAVKYGLCSWNKLFAERIWLRKISSKYQRHQKTDPVSKHPEGPYPEVYSEFDTGYDILRSRAIELMSKPLTKYFITVDELYQDLEHYYVIYYWDIDYYNLGHVENSVYYARKKSLTRSTNLNTLPANQPIVVYCNSGHYSAAVAAYLSILGYKAKSLVFGTNSIMYKMMNDKIGFNFTRKDIMDYPLVFGNSSSGSRDDKASGQAKRN